MEGTRVIGRAALLATALLTLAACAARPVPTAGWPEVAAEPAAGFAAPTGASPLPVRAVVREGGAARVAAAECVATSERFRAAFAAPAVVTAPTWGRDSGRVRVDCAGPEGRGAAIVSPVVQRTDGLWGIPALGVGVTAGGDAFATFGGWWNRGEGPAVRYPTVEVVLE
jgi:hypothetical protein